MPIYSYAIISAILWAISAQILNIGLKNIPQHSKGNYIFVGLYFSMLTGAITLLPKSKFSSINDSNMFLLLLAGIFTYPLATGVYYATGVAFGNRMELASQFAKVKPVLSVLIAIYLLKEEFVKASYISFAFILLGTLLLLFSNTRNGFNVKAVLLGLLTALFWSVGELFLKLGIGNINAINANIIALVSALLISTFFIFPIVKKIGLENIKLTIMWPFMVHGVLSFGIGYTLFFESIKQIGIGKTVLINATWPFFAVVIASIYRIANKEKVDLSLMTWSAIFLIMAGSVVQTVYLIIVEK